MDKEHFVAREPLPGQKGDKLYPIRCENPDCGVNKHTGLSSGGQRLLGHYRAGTVGEVRCPRCGFVNHIKVETRRKRHGKTTESAKV
jgi:phage FluMu protein Com